MWTENGVTEKERTHCMNLFNEKNTFMVNIIFNPSKIHLAQLKMPSAITVPDEPLVTQQ